MRALLRILRAFWLLALATAAVAITVWLKLAGVLR